MSLAKLHAIVMAGHIEMVIKGNNMNSRLIGFCFAVMVLFGNAVQASSAPTSFEAIMQDQRLVEAEFSRGDYPDLTPRSKRLLKSAQDKIFSIAEGKSSVDEMSPDDQVRFKNAVEQVNAILTGRRSGEENKEVCWRERQVGSQVMKTVCGTEKERNEVRQGAHDYLSKPSVCVPPGCGQ